MNLQSVLLRLFPFCKTLPVFTPNPKNRTESFVVSEFYPGMIGLLKNIFSVIEGYDYNQQVNTNHAIIHVGDFNIEKKTSEFIELVINKKRYIIHNGGSNPVFTYYNKYAYLGSILNCALKHYYKDLLIKDDGLYLSKFDYIKENSNTLIIEEKVTTNFFDLLNAFELSVEVLINGFHNKELYFNFLMTSKYLNVHSLHSLKDCNSEFLKEFYNYVENHRREDVSNFTWSEEQIFYNFPKFKLNAFKKKYQNTLDFKTTINDKLEFNLIADALKHITTNKNDVGFIIGQYKQKRFSSKETLHSFLHASVQHEVLSDITYFAQEIKSK